MSAVKRAAFFIGFSFSDRIAPLERRRLVGDVRELQRGGSIAHGA
jgi:hypothetical protein